MECGYCTLPRAQSVCAHCQDVPYCSDKCADIHWPAHVGASARERFPRSLILPGPGNLWVGGINALRDLDGIDAVVTVMHPDADELAFIAEHVGPREHLRYDMHDRDGERIDRAFNASCAFIHDHISAGRSVLVHCFAGVSRSVTLCLWYMMRKRGFDSPRSALAQVQSQRWWAGPNDGFMRTLEKMN